MNNPSPWWYWLAWVAGGLLVLLGLWLLCRSLVADRARGRKRCPGCWYDMAGAPTLTCPECGRVARSDGQLLRTRRRHGRAVAALVIVFVGYCILRTPALLKGQWTGLIPTTALAFIAPAEVPPGMGLPRLTGIPIPNGYFAQSPSRSPTTLSEFKERILADLHSAMWERAQSGRSWRWQTSLYVNRLLAAHHIDVAECIELPGRWPVNESVPYLLRTPPALSGMLFGVRTPGGTWQWNNVRQGEPLSTPSPGTDQLEVEIGIGVGTRRLTVLWTRSVSLPLVVGGDAAHFLTPVSSPELDATVRSALDPRLALDDRGQLSLIVNDRDDGPLWTHIDFSIGVRLELSVDRVTLARTQSICSWTRPVWKDWEDWQIEWTPTVDALFTTDAAGRKVLAPEALARATISVTADPLMAARPYLEWPFDKPSTRYWGGAFEVPARFAEHPGNARR